MSKNYLDMNVYEATIQRLNYIYEEFSEDEIWLSLSGGKDSSICFYLMKEIALAKGVKTINVMIIDLEGHYKLHNDFLEELIADQDIQVNGYWICLPFNLSNASSFHMPKWLCWDAGKQSKWVRPMPSNRLTVNERNNPFGSYFRKGMEFEEFIIQFPRYLVEQKGCGKVAQVIGIRAQESYNRYRKMKVRANREFYNGVQWILKQKSTGYNTYSVHPIYDWDVKDVWKYASSVPYNKVYDKMYLAGCSLNSMRICQPYGEESRDNIDLYCKIEPETWARICERVWGVNFAKLYKNKNIMKGRIRKPEGATWESWAKFILASLPSSLRDHYLKIINAKCKKNIPYRLIASMILKGDYNGKTINGKIIDDLNDKNRRIRERYAKL